MSSALRVGIIGAGTLGKSLALGLSAVGWRVAAVASRTHTSAQTLADMIPGCDAPATPQEVVNRCDLVFLTVPDDAISLVASSLSWPPGRWVTHCSGAGSLDLLKPAADMGADCSSLHPFQTFAGASASQNALERFKGVTFAVEGQDRLLKTLETMAIDLGGRTLRLSPADRGLYHASAVMSCGYLVALLKAAAGAWRLMGATEEQALQVILPIAKATLNNVESLGPQMAATGPVVRGDVDTIRRHFRALTAQAPELLPLYVALTKASIPLTAPAVEDEKLRDMERLISEYRVTSVLSEGQAGQNRSKRHA